MGPDIEAHDIEQAVAGTLGQADQLACEGVHLFDGEAFFDCQLLDGGAKKTADAVGDEVGGVLAGYDAFAEMTVGEMGDEVPDLGQSFGAGDHLEQMQIARRIEEVRSEEMLAELGGESLGDAGEGNAP